MESTHTREPWNKGKLIGQKPPLKPQDIWAIRIHLQNRRRIRDLAMFNLAIDSKLRGWRPEHLARERFLRVGRVASLAGLDHRYCVLDAVVGSDGQEHTHIGDIFLACPNSCQQVVSQRHSGFFVSHVCERECPARSSSTVRNSLRNTSAAIGLIR